MKHERASTVATESSYGSQRLELSGPVSPVSSGWEGRRCGKLLESELQKRMPEDGLF